MPDGETKQRFSARVKTDTLDRIETYQDENNLDNRSNAIDVLVEEELGEQAPDASESDSEQATRSTVYAVALTAVVYLAAFPTATEYLLLGAAAVFAIDSVVGYAKEAQRLLPETIEFAPGGDPGDADETATAAMSPRARIVGGGLMLLALAWTVISGVF